MPTHITTLTSSDTNAIEGNTSVEVGRWWLCGSFYFLCLAQLANGSQEV